MSTETDAEGQPAYVLVRGPAPHDDHYEFITYRSKHDGGHCFEVDLPKNRSLLGGGCDEPDTPHGLSAKNGFAIASVGGNSDVDQKFQLVSGRVSPDIDSVRVTFDGRPAKVELTTPPQPLLERLGFGRSFKVFMAFLYGTEHGGTIRVSAVRRGVGAVAHTNLTLPDLVAASVQTCRWAQRLADKGQLSERNARRTCRSVEVKPAR